MLEPPNTKPLSPKTPEAATHKLPNSVSAPDCPQGSKYGAPGPKYYNLKGLGWINPVSDSFPKQGDPNIDPNIL